MNIKIRFVLALAVLLALITSCQNKDVVVTSEGLNQADNIYK